MKGSRSFRKTRKNNSRRNKGGRQPSRSTGTRRSVATTYAMYRALDSSKSKGSSLVDTLMFLFVALMIFSSMNKINDPLFSSNVHHSHNPMTHAGLTHVPKKLPGPEALGSLNLAKSPAFTRVSNKAIGSTPANFVRALGIPSKHASRMNIMPSDVYYMEALRQLELGPTTTVKELIKKVMEEAQGDHKEEVKKALRNAEYAATESDILSRSRSTDEMKTIRESRSKSHSRSRSN